MICPSCGAEVPELNFCVNCGAPLASAQGASAVENPDGASQAQQIVEPLQQPSTADGQTAMLGQAPAASPYTQPLETAFQQPAGTQELPVAEVPGDAAWEAAPPQAYQVGDTLQMPPQPGVGYAPSAGAPEPPRAPGSRFDMPTPENTAPNAAFVLAIVGLVLSALFVTCLPGIVCSIIALVLNAGYNKKGLVNRHKTSTLAMGIIGLAIGVISVIITVMTLVLAANIVSEAERQGMSYSAEGLHITTDSSGNINVSVDDSSSASSASASAAASGSLSAASSSASASTSASASSAASSAYDDAKYHDSEFNPTLYALMELNGSELSDLLDYYGYRWDNDLVAWAATDGSMFGAENGSGSVGKGAITALPKGCEGEAIALYLVVEGYSTPAEALSALTSDVVVEDRFGDDEVMFAIVHGSLKQRYLVSIAATDDPGEQAMLLFTEPSIANGVFESIVGVNAGSSADEVWQAITGGSHIGGHIGG